MFPGTFLGTILKHLPVETHYLKRRHSREIPQLLLCNQGSSTATHQEISGVVLRKPGSAAWTEVKVCRETQFFPIILQILPYPFSGCFLKPLVALKCKVPGSCDLTRGNPCP
eukprot:jgi/Botrbrau1/19074/Bobra.0772s0002.1